MTAGALTHAIQTARPPLVQRVASFYCAHPDEELTHADLRAKFGITKWTAVWVIRELVEEGLLESVHIVRLRVKGIAREMV